MKIASVLLLAILVLGCLHSQVIERKLSEDGETFVGKHTDELFLKKRPPDLKEGVDED